MLAMQTTPPTSVSAEELRFLGSRCRILATSESTGGNYGLVDMIEVAPGDMPPLHVHHTHDEGFLLLEGSLSLFLPDREIALRPNEFVLAPRGVPHTYQVGEAPARWLVLSTPAGFEQFVEDVAALAELTPQALTTTAAAHDIEILGPPGTMP
jgi:mannose-6-phosphate isomerase-like protein (cupin superfamily)